MQKFAQGYSDGDHDDEAQYDMMLEALQKDINFLDSRREALLTEVKDMARSEEDARQDARSKLDEALRDHTGAQQVINEMEKTLLESNTSLRVAYELKKQEKKKEDNIRATAYA